MPFEHYNKLFASHLTISMTLPQQGPSILEQNLKQAKSLWRIFPAAVTFMPFAGQRTPPPAIPSTQF